jgi:hypothetical protein
LIHFVYLVYSVCSVYFVYLFRLVYLVCFVHARFSGGFGLRGMLAPSLGRPKLRLGREGFPQVQILEDRSACAKSLRETPPPCDRLREIWVRFSPHAGGAVRQESQRLQGR